MSSRRGGRFERGLQLSTAFPAVTAPTHQLRISKTGTPALNIGHNMIYREIIPCESPSALRAVMLFFRIPDDSPLLRSEGTLVVFALVQ
jgi:hypothetical protein